MLSKSKISHSSEISKNKVLANTYRLLAMTTIFSAVTAGLGMFFNISFIFGFACSLAAFGILFVINKNADRPQGIVWTFAFTGLLGLALTPMLSHYLSLENGGTLVTQALVATSVVFFSLSGYALTTKKDFSFMGGFLIVGLMVAIVTAIANIFLQIPALHLAINAAIVFIMSGFILFDTSRIIHGGETNYIRATVAMYLNLYNLFTSILQLLGAFNSED